MQTDPKKSFKVSWTCRKSKLVYKQKYYSATMSNKASCNNKAVHDDQNIYKIHLFLKIFTNLHGSF